MHHVDAPERVTRALGVYEWTGELSKPTAARFVPISLYINGAMQDAGLYLARPVPFALQTGDVYSLEHAGEPQGLLDLDYAQHVVTNQALKDDDPAGAWYGYGNFTPQTAAPLLALHPSAHPPVLQADGKPLSSADDGRPHMARRGDASSPASPAGSGDSKDASAKGDAPDTTKPAGNEGNSGGSNSPNSTSTNTSSTAGGTDDTDRPTLRHRDPSQDATRRRDYGKSSKQASVTAAGPKPGDDPDRPVLGRNNEADAATTPLTGLPADMHQAVGISDPNHRDGHDFAREWETPAERAETMASLEAVARSRIRPYLVANSLIPSSRPLPTESPTGASSPARATPTATVPAGKSPDTNANADDAGAPPKLERGTPSQYQTPRTPQVATAATPPGVTTSPSNSPSKPAAAPPRSAVTHSSSNAAGSSARSSTPGTTHSTAHSAAQHGTKAGTVSPASLLLAQSTLTSYTLSYGGLPTFVYTAAASVSAKSASLASAAGIAPAVSAVPAAVYVTVVAQRLPSGELQVALSNVTDSLHLDRGPRLRLIDAVDPDDSHRASLLFELRGASSRQFALYRLTTAQAEQIFTTASIE